MVQGGVHTLGDFTEALCYTQGFSVVKFRRSTSPSYRPLNEDSYWLKVSQGSERHVRAMMLQLLLQVRGVNWMSDTDVHLSTFHISA